MLYDSKSIFEDQIVAVENSSKKKGLNSIDLAMFTDGLRDEREQGITIDVAYRYFTTPKRKFIIADTPGHLQYTRNMVTGASTANVAIVLIDARKGVLEQTKRHSYIASLLQISHIIVCINKMDLVNYNEIVFNRIVKEYEEIASKMMIKDIHYIPISALCGDNVVERSRNMNWYQDSPLLHTLETIQIISDTNKIDARFPVQTVIRAKNNDFRGYAGRIADGISTKIIIYDHNADRTDYPISILNDLDAKKYIDGSAFHLYGGNINDLTKVHTAHPDKNLYFTEQWVGLNEKFEDNLKWHTRELIIGATRNWCKTVLEWNLAADSNLEPHTNGGCTECLGALTIDGNTVTKNVAYYIIAHA